MAERRMFAKTIIDSDAFLDMPLSCQCLYFHLCMRADDDGFINNPKKIQRMIGASEDDLKLLIMKNFLIPFETGVVVIKHWKIHNYIQNDRYKETVYTEEKSRLEVKKNKAYTVPEPECIHDGYILETQVRLGKDSIVKNNIIDSKESICQTVDPVRQVIDEWNLLSKYGVSKVNRIAKSSTRYKMANARIGEYGLEEVLRTVRMIKDCDFLLGRSQSGWLISFDWFVKPNNFPKVNEGKYLNRVANAPSQPDANVDPELSGYQ